MRGDHRLELANAQERPVPARLKFRRHEAVQRIGRIILPEGALGGVTCRFEIARHRLASLIAAVGGSHFGVDRRRDSARLDRLEREVSIASSTRNPPKAMQRGSP